MARIDRYIELLNKATAGYEENNPDWRGHAFLWILETAARVLRRTLDGPEPKAKWSSPFWAFQYPVAWDWEAWKEDPTLLRMQYGQLTSQNTRRRRQATRALANIMTRQQIYAMLHDCTHQVASVQHGKSCQPIFPEDVYRMLTAVKGTKQRAMLEEALFFPFSVGAATIDVLPGELRSGQKIPSRMAEQLQRATRSIDVPELKFSGTSDGHPIDISLIFQIFPLVIDERRRTAYFPLTFGLMLSSPKDEPVYDGATNPPKWLDPEQWSRRKRAIFWTGLLKAVRHQHQFLKPRPRDEVNEAVPQVTARLEVEITSTSPDGLHRAADQVLQRLHSKGVIASYRVHTHPLLPTPDAVREMAEQLAATEKALTPADKGSALEKLMAKLFRAVPGFEVTTNVRTSTEEIDLKLLNSDPDPRWRNDAIILLECKNWSGRCGKDEVALFELKLRNRRGRAKLGFLVSWNGFADTVRKELLRGSRGETVVGLLTGEHIRRAVQTGDIRPELRAAFDEATEN